MCIPGSFTCVSVYFAYVFHSSGDISVRSVYFVEVPVRLLVVYPSFGCFGGFWGRWRVARRWRTSSRAHVYTCNHFGLKPSIDFGRSPLARAFVRTLRASLVSPLGGKLSERYWRRRGNVNDDNLGGALFPPLGGGKQWRRPVVGTTVLY